MMKPSDNQTNRADNQAPVNSLEDQAARLLDQSIEDLPAGIVSRMHAARTETLDTVFEARSGWLQRFDWRPAFATAALALLAAILLYVPEYPEEQYLDSWVAEDEFLLGDDLSLYLWLSDDSALDPGEEG